MEKKNTRKAPVRSTGRKPLNSVKPPLKDKSGTAALQAGKGFDFRSVIFLVVLVLIYFLFISDLFSMKELTNNYIRYKAGWISSVQVALYTLLAASFGYFGYLFLSGKKEGKLSTGLIVFSLLLVVCIQMVAFNPAFEVAVDDNAGYMIAAKSLVEKGGAYLIYKPVLVPDNEVAIGLPLMLAPIYKLWGMDYLKMEYLIFFLMLGSVILCFFFFRKVTNNPFLALLITVLFGTHPYIVVFSSIIMTEIPFIFWMFVTLFLLLKYEASPKFNIWYMLALLFSIFYCYLTRAIGVGVGVAALVYLFARSGIFDYLKRKDYKIWKDVKIKKLLILGFTVALAFIAYQIRARIIGAPSQAETFFGYFSWTRVGDNLKSIWMILPQNLFAGRLVMSGPEPMNIKWFIVIAFIIAGLCIDLWKKGIMSMVMLFTMTFLIMGNVATAPTDLSRYMIIYTPFMIWFFYLSIKTLVDLIIKKANFGAFAGMVALTLILLSSFKGDAFYVQSAHPGFLYPPYYQSFIDCGKWAKENLPADAIVASRKERSFYIFSELRGYKYMGVRDRNIKYSQAYAKTKLDEMAACNTSYLVLDSFNTTAQFVQIIKDNPDKFKMLKKFGEDQSGPCYIFQLVKWWKT